jgi:hypothetical protein
MTARVGSPRGVCITEHIQVRFDASRVNLFTSERQKRERERGGGDLASIFSTSHLDSTRRRRGGKGEVARRVFQ